MIHSSLDLARDESRKALYQAIRTGKIQYFQNYGLRDTLDWPLNCVSICNDKQEM